MGEVVPLWDGTPPHALGQGPADTPTLEWFHPVQERATGAAMLIFPGGEYAFLSEKSGPQYGMWLAEAGITGIVVNFRLGVDGYHYPAILGDAWQALAVVRERAGEWEIDPARIGVIGTSAGGHLASLMVTGTTPSDAQGRADAATRPALGVLCYAVLSMRDPLAHVKSRRNFLGDQEHCADLQERFSPELRVDADTAPCFLWHTMTDTEVPADNSRQFAEALHSNGVPYELHLYEQGAHALALAREEGLFWTSECVRWLRSHGF